MSSLTPKIIGGSTIALGTLGVGAYFGIKELLKPTTLKGKLVSKGFKPIRSDDIAQWGLEFESDQEEIKKAFGNEVTNGTKLKEECEKRLNSDSEKDIENVKKWCGIRSISNEIARRKKTLLTKVEGAGLKWANTYSKRIHSNSDKSHFGSDASKLIDNDTGVRIAKEWCQKAENLDYLASQKDNAKLVEDWCTEEGAKQ